VLCFFPVEAPLSGFSGRFSLGRRITSFSVYPTRQLLISPVHDADHVTVLSDAFASEASSRSS